MQTNGALPPAPPALYADVLSLVPDEPWAVPARTVLLGGMPGVTVDDLHAPSVVAVETMTADGPSIFFFGAAERPALVASIRALVGPVTVRADVLIASQIPRWRPDASARRWATFTSPASGMDAAFSILPPGGVRRLRVADARHLTPFPAWLWAGYGSPGTMLREGIAYARYLRAELVAVACTAGATERYDAIAAYTIERTRRNGFARECALRLVGAIQNERGKRPMLTASVENAGALALARSLGLTVRDDQTVYDVP